MKFPAFVKALDELVWKWGSEHGDSLTPTEELQVIFDKVRNDCAWELAQKQAALDKLLPIYHKQLLGKEKDDG